MSLLEGAAETAAGHGNVPWGRFFRSRTVWLLWLQYYCLAYGWYFYITWLPTYIQEARGQTMEQSAFLAGTPLFFGGLGSLACGYLLTYMDRKMVDARRSRRFMGALGCAGAGALLIVSVYLSEPIWAMVAMGIASFSGDLAMPPAWGACMDVGGKYAGSLSGSMNMAGNIAGFVSPAVFAYILRWSGDNWIFTFYVSAAIYFIGAVSWLFIDPVTPLDQAEAAGNA